MSKANKTIIAVVIGAVAAYTGSSWYLGKQIQSGIEDAIADANMRYASQTFSGLNEAPEFITIAKYDRGIFSTNAQYKLTAVSAQGKTVEYQINSNIDHGFFPKQAISNGIYTPLLAYATTSFNISDELAKQVGLSQGTTAASVTSVVNLNGDSTSDMEMVALQLTMDDGIVIDFSGGKAIINLTNNQSDIDIKGNIDSYAIKQASINENILVKDIKLNSTAKLLDNGNQQKTNILIDAIDISSLDNDIESNAKNLAITLSSEQKGDILNADVNYNIAQVFVDNKNVGKFDFGMQFDSFDLPSLIDIGKKYSQLVDKYGAASFADLNINSQEQEEWIEKIIPFLAAKPKLSIKPLAWGNNAGTSQASFEINLSSAEDTNADTLAIEKIIESSSFKLEVSRAMIMELFKTMAEGGDGAEGADEVGAVLFDQYANLLVSQGIATKDGDKLSISIQVNPSQDQASINDKTMTMNEFFMLAFGLIMFL